MKCRNPFIKGRAAFPCGQCMPCRFNRRRLWTHRIMLEAMQYGNQNSFVTLTYSDDALPRSTSGMSTLDPSHFRDFLKRFRKSIEPMRIRYYGVGEYGDQTWRPHYHAALFGWGSCARGGTHYRSGRLACCLSCSKVADAWSAGRIHVGGLTTHSAQYLAGYVTKKMTRTDDVRLMGRAPEFARMSLRPGIGASAMHEVASVLMQFNLEESEADVPSALRHGSRLLPLGRYLRGLLRTYVGKEKNAPDQTMAEIFEAVRPMWEAASVLPTSDARKTAFKNLIIEAGDQAVRQMEARAQLFKQRRSL